MSSATPDDQIANDIAEALKPWAPRNRQIETGKKAGEIKALSNTELRAEIINSARKEIDRLRIVVPDFFHRNAIRKTRSDARDIIKSIDNLAGQLSAKTLSPELRLRLGDHSRVIGSPTDIVNMPLPLLLNALQQVRDLCHAADVNQPDKDQVKHWCARIALRLVLDFSKDDPTAGSAKTSYCTIASLLYQGVTEREGLELRRICQEILRPYREAKLLPRRKV